MPQKMNASLRKKSAGAHPAGVPQLNAPLRKEASSAHPALPISAPLRKKSASACAAQPPLEAKGLQKLSLVDYPNKVCATVFVGGCNFRCPFCHNADLVLTASALPTIPTSELVDFLTKRRKWLDAVCITGGEPAMHNGIVELASRIKELGLLVKLDTNGSFPNAVAGLVEKKLVDYVAVDIKAGRASYSKAAGVSVDVGEVEKTARLLMGSAVDYEFRTTAVPGFFGEEDARDIADWLAGAKRYVLQQFRPSEKMIDPMLKSTKPFSVQQLENFAEILRPHFGSVELRTA